MDTSTVDQVLNIVWIVLKIIGATSILGIISFMTAYYALPPNLAVDEVQNRSEHNFESRIIIKNIGRLPAFNVIVDVSKMSFVMGGITMDNMNAIDCGIPTSKLSSGEKMEVPVCPHVEVPPGAELTSCDYEMKLKYYFKLPFFKKEMSKKWYVQLRDSGNDYHWQLSMR